MSIIERILFWIAIIVLLVAVVGEKSKLSALEAQVEKAKSMNVIYNGEDEGEDEGDEEEDEEEDEGEGDEDSGDEGNDESDTEEDEGGEE